MEVTIETHILSDAEISAIQARYKISHLDSTNLTQYQLCQVIAALEERMRQ